MNADQAAAIVQLLTGTIESEAGATRKVLAAVPTGNRDYKPDPKSRSAWDLAVHLARGISGLPTRSCRASSSGPASRRRRRR